MLFESFFLFSHSFCLLLSLLGQFSHSSRFFLFDSHLLFQDLPFFSSPLLCCFLCLLHFEFFCFLQCLSRFSLCFQLGLMCESYGCCLFGSFSLACEFDGSDSLIFFFCNSLFFKLSPLCLCFGEISNRFFCNQLLLLSFLGGLFSSNFVRSCFFSSQFIGF